MQQITFQIQIGNTRFLAQIQSSHVFITKPEKYFYLQISKSNTHNSLNVCSCYNNNNNNNNNEVRHKQDLPILVGGKNQGLFLYVFNLLRTIIQAKTWMLACGTQIFILPP